MDAARKRVEFQSQVYAPFWRPALLSASAESKAAEFAILYAAFPRAFTRTLSDVLERLRVQGPGDKRISVAEIIAIDDVPSGLKFSYTVNDDGLLVCDFWTPVQPQLFGIQPK